MTESVLVVGGGFIGGHLAVELHRRGHPVRVITRSQTAAIGAFDCVEGSASDPERLAKATTDVDHVFLSHSGLFPADAERSPGDDYLRITSPITTLAGLGRRFRSVTYFSSGGTVYGDAHTIPTPETSDLRPIGAYGINRVAAELAVMAAARKGLAESVNVIRCGNVYGPGQATRPGYALVPTLTERLRAGQPIAIFGDGSVSRDYVYVTDVVCAAADLAIRRAKGCEIYNCGSSVDSSVNELVNLLGELTQATPVLERHPARPFDVARSALAIDKLRSAVNFEPTDLAIGLAATVGAQSPA